jgi:hypothetical protein
MFENGFRRNLACPLVQSSFLSNVCKANLRNAMEIASGHSGPANAVAAPGALEFFAFGVPLQKAVSKSTPCTQEDD